MGYSVKDRIRINLRAKRKVGLIKRKDYDSFMEDCVSSMMESDQIDDEDDARDACELIWEDEGNDS